MDERSHIWFRRPWRRDRPAVLSWWHCPRCGHYVEGARSAWLNGRGEVTDPGRPADDALVDGMTCEQAREARDARIVQEVLES